MTPDLLAVCVSAFVAVFVLLSFLAVVMRLLLVAFPAPVSDGPDAAVLAAVTSAVTAVYPGTRVTKVEENR